MTRVAFIALATTLLVAVSYRALFLPFTFSVSDAEEDGDTGHRRMTGSLIDSTQIKISINDELYDKGKHRFVMGKSNSKKKKKISKTRTMGKNAKTMTTPSALHPHRPIMHTFFTDLTPEQSTEHPDQPAMSAGMTSEAHNSMLRVWQKSWQQAGWDTRILRIEDAMEHVDFNSLRHTIEHNFRMGEYDKARYYRWIAMAAAGGGWMSDYDTLPLHDFTGQAYPLPMQEALVVYERHVPSLLSGNATEWTRLIHALVHHASEQTKQSAPDQATPSDMFSLLALLQKQEQQTTTLTKDTTFIARSQVLGIHDLPDGVQWTPDHCQAIAPTNTRAVHFSHYFIATNWMPKHREHSMDDRPFIASKWLHDWLRDCGGPKPFQELGEVSSSDATATR